MALATRLTDSELLYEAARSLSGRFDIIDLVIRAAQKFPERFGLKGHPHHPDSHKVFALVSGKRGLVAKGWLRRPAANYYEAVDLDAAEPLEAEPEAGPEYRPPVKKPKPVPKPAVSLWEEAVRPMAHEVELWRSGKRGQAQRSYQQRLMRQHRWLGLEEMTKRLEEAATTAIRLPPPDG